jgi:hypothetical protein
VGGGPVTERVVEAESGWRTVVETPTERGLAPASGFESVTGLVPDCPVSLRVGRDDEGADGRVDGIDGAVVLGRDRGVGSDRAAVEGGAENPGFPAADVEVAGAAANVVGGPAVVGGVEGDVVVGGGGARSRSPEPGPDPLSAVPVVGPTRLAADTTMSLLFVASPVEARSTMLDWMVSLGLI